MAYVSVGERNKRKEKNQRYKKEAEKKENEGKGKRVVMLQGTIPTSSSDLFIPSEPKAKACGRVDDKGGLYCERA